MIGGWCFNTAWFMKFLGEIIFVLINATVASIVFFVLRSSKKKEREEVLSNNSYKISKKRYEKYADVANSVIINTTLTFSDEDEKSALEDDRGYAGYENVVFKGVTLLKSEGFKVPSLEGHDDV